MRKRPLFTCCLLLLLLFLLLDILGIPLVRGNPLPKAVQSWILEHPHATVSGQVAGIRETENGCSLDLYGTALYPAASREDQAAHSYPLRNLRVYFREAPEASIGDLLLLTGELERVPETRNPGEFDRQSYYACDHIYYFLKNASVEKRLPSRFSLRRLLAQCRTRLSQVLSDSAGADAPVFRAMVLGDKTGLDQDLKLLYQMAGIIHILAVSGLHISGLGLGLYALLKRTRLGFTLSGLTALLLMVLFGMMTGSSISTMRAVCMFLVATGGRLASRSYDLLTALGLGAVLTALEAPARILSASFLLSFGAVAGIAIILPVLSGLGSLIFTPILRPVSTSSKWEPVLKILRGTMTSLAGSVSVMLMTLPVSLYYYGELSLAGIFLNLLVLPTAGVVLGCGLTGALAGALLPGIGLSVSGLALLPGRGILLLYDTLCSLAARAPVCTWVGGRPAPWAVAGYYGVLALLLLSGSRLLKRRGPLQEKKQARRLLPFILPLLPVSIFFLGYHPVTGLSITCLDVGQGDGIVLRTKGGHAYLIDGGSSSKTALGSNTLLPFLKSQGISHLDGIFVSHTDEDHISGITELLELADRHLSSVSIGTLYLPRWEEPPAAWKNLERLAKACGTRVQPMGEGVVLEWGPFSLRALAPLSGARGQDVNEDCLVLLFSYKEFLGLFTGDIGEETESRLLDRLPDIDFLKVGHHGSRFSSSAAFLDRLQPELGVISCSQNNRYGHPSPDAVSRLEEAGCHLEYTINSGAVTISSDGKRMTVSRYLDS